VIVPGSRQLTNGEVLQHVQHLESRFKSQKREKTVPSGLKDAIKDVSFVNLLFVSTFIKHSIPSTQEREDNVTGRSTQLTGAIDQIYPLKVNTTTPEPSSKARSATPR
jgi:hypothetical protein